MVFKNRVDAGRRLAKALSSYAGLPHHLVIGLPRGGVIVAKEVADILNLPLEIVIVRKIGASTNPEFALGALAGEEIFLDENTIQMLGIDREEVERIIWSEKKEVARREFLYRKDRKAPSFQDQTVLLIDDGIATGATLHASIAFLRKQKVRSIILAVPVAPQEALKQFKELVEGVFCLNTPSNFSAVGEFYLDFTPVTDEEVCKALKSQSQKEF
jgi:putative phosphoribosyl transferase